MTIETRPFDSAAYLNTADDVVGYLNAVLAERDSALLTYALGQVARARGLSELARQSGLTREGLHTALSKTTRPEFDTIAQLIAGLGLRLQVAAA